jgi:hypothetical protein|tara:strand:- start:4100 stop:4315 length:216 start_codon:yes stop_codon:yes gene_type:complete
MQVRLRYNNKHRTGEKPWKLTIDGSVLLVNDVNFNCPVQGHIEDLPEIGVKVQIGCEAQRIIIENDKVIVE